MNKGKQPGETGQKLAESVEQRGLAEGNAQGLPTDGTLSPRKVSRGLLGVREAARRDRKLQFTALLHHIDVPLLRASFEALNRKATAGVDGVTWGAYREGLCERLEDLHNRIHKGQYRAQPSKRGRIAKEDGSERLLGIAALEDKIVQQAVVTVLNQIYEEDFMGFSYGFRPGRDPHGALDALWVGLTERPINWVLDMDIRGYFDHIQHDWLIRFLGYRIADKRVIRLIGKWLKAGVLDQGKWLSLSEGSPQGAVISPFLANVYLHYVFDLWSEHRRRKQTQGAMIVVRYADDIVVGFQHREEAEAFHRELVVRLNGFGLSLHPIKTRLIEFGRYALIRRKTTGKGKPETFDFLGFTHICSRSRRGVFTIRRKTIGKRLHAKLRAIKKELRCRMNESVPETGQWLRSVLQGYYHYFAVPNNLSALVSLRYQLGRAWLRMLRRRSQKARKHLSWEKFKRIQEYWLPKPRIYHPWPNVRFRRQHLRQEPGAVIPHAGICAGGAS